MPYFSPEDTIVAVATPSGRAGMGVVRLSGKRALAIIEQLFSAGAGKPPGAFPSHTLRHGWLRGDSGEIDEVVVAVMRAPRSYTGEDVVEISAHGSPLILGRIVSACLERGARHAGPGEFTFRAFVNGKIDLARAEAVQELIAGGAALSVRAALEQLKGALSEQVHAWRTRLAGLLAHLEAGLDYAEEDIRFIAPDELKRDLASLKIEIDRWLSSANKGRVLREGIKVAIIGKPNAGKSSLLNALLKTDRAIVTAVPGTTRDIIEETLEIRGVPVVVRDTAGLRRQTGDPVEAIGQERTREAARGADIVLLVLDASDTLSEADRHIARDILPSLTVQKIILVFNKSDLPPRLDRGGPGELFPQAAARATVSALTGQGVGDLESAILSCAGAEDLAANEPLLLSERHRAVATRLSRALDETCDALERGATDEIAAFHLRDALDILGEITGETTTDELLAAIFSRFCVGK